MSAAAVLASALAAALLCRLVVPPPPRLRALLDVPPALPRGQARSEAVARLLDPLLDDAVHARLALRLRQAGLARGGSPRAATLEHWSRVLVRAGTQGAAFGAVALVVGSRPGVVIGGLALGAVAGAARQHATVERTVEERRQRLRIELYTVNQLLALDVRAGGGVMQALERTTRRGEGVLAEELRDVLAAVRAGLPLEEALEQAARLTPEPAAARTYRLLAKGARHGTDLGTGLRALNEDLRVQRAEAIERAATRRRAAMLLPIIGLLAPVMLLFIVAPLPSLLFGIR